MNWQENKLEITVLALISFVIVAFLTVTQMYRHSKSVSQVEINYEMPRAKSSYAPELDLANREVLRNYLNPYAKGSKTAVVAKAGLVDSKKTSLVAQSQAQAKKIAAKKKKSEVQVKYVDADHSKVGSDSRHSEVANQAPQNANQILDQKKTAQTAIAKKDAPEETKDWKKIFATAPSQKALVEFMQEYQSGKVTESLYYEVLKSMVLNQNTETQNLAIYGLRSFVTVRSFTEAVHWAALPELQKEAGIMTALESFLVSFNQKNRLGVLAQTLQSSDQEVVVKSAQIIAEGVTRIKSGESLESTRDQRVQVSTSSATSSLSSYKRFVSTLTALLTSQDQDVAQAASAALSQIQSVNVAQNP